MTVSRALMAFFTITTLVLIIAVSISNYVQVTAAIKKERQALSVHTVNEMQQAAKTFADYRIRTMQDYARFPILAQAVMQSETSREDLADFFDTLSILDSRPQFTLLDYKGQIIYSIHGNIIDDQARKKMIHHLLDNGEKSYWGICKTEKESHWIFAVPVLYNGLKEGIFICEIPVVDFETDQNISTLLGGHRMDLLVDSEIVFSAGPDLTTSPEIYPIPGSDIFIQFAWGFHQADWKQKISMVYVSSLIIIILGICSFSALFILIQRYISTPLGIFRKNALSLAKDYSGVRLKKEFYLEEIAQSAHSFNSMADQIQARVDELEKLKNSLENEVKQQTIEISQERKNLEKILYNAPTGMLLLDESGKVNMVNQTMAEQLHLDLDLKKNGDIRVGDILNCPRIEGNSEICGHKTACTECPVNLVFGRSLQAVSNVKGIEFAHTVTRDGQKITLYFLIQGTHLNMKGKPHALLTFANITDLKEAENALVEERQRLDGILRGTNAGTWEWNIQTGETTFNHRWAEIIGYTLDEISPVSIDTWMKFAHPDDFEKSGQLLDRHFSGEIEYYECETRMKHKEGAWVWVLARGKVVSWTEDKKPLIMMGTHQDITRAKKNQNVLKISRDAAESANRAKSEFIANMSHEIRTPLNAVLGFSDLLSSIVSQPRQKTYLDSIQAAGKGLLTIINDILDLSKIEAGLLKMEFDYINIKDVIADVMLIFDHTCKEKNLTTLVDLEPDLPAGLLLDEIRLRQILLNLVGNAVKFTESGRIEIQVRADAQQAKERCDLIIKIKDTGIGIPENEQKTIFDAFHQQDGQSTRKFGGTGLGLTITRRLVNLMNGHIDLESRVNQGTVFTITLNDIQVSDPLPADTGFDTCKIIENIHFDTASVLVIDDIESNRLLIKEQLMNTGLEVLGAQDGRSALSMIDKTPPDLILTDIRMPGISGYAVLDIIRSNPKICHLPVIAITASVATEKEDSRFAQFNALLLKPIQQDALLYELSRFLPNTIQHTCSRPYLDPDFNPDIVDASALLDQLKTNFTPLAEKFEGAIEMDNVKDFAMQLSRLGNDYKAEFVTQYAEQLKNSADTFDILSTQNLIKKFPDIIQTIEETSNEKK